MYKGIQMAEQSAWATSTVDEQLRRVDELLETNQKRRESSLLPLANPFSHLGVYYCRLDEEANAFVSAVQDLVGRTVGDYTAAMECLESENGTCQHLDVSVTEDLLQFLLSECDKRPTGGSCVLDLLQYLIFEVGLVFPIAYEPTVAASSTFLHEIPSAEYARDALALWCQLRAYLRRYCVEQLGHMTTSAAAATELSGLIGLERRRLVVAQCLLYKVPVVGKWYMQLRKKDFELETACSFTDVSPLDDFVKSVNIAKRMISDDVEILRDDAFMNDAELAPLTYMEDVYVSLLQKKLEKVADDLCRCRVTALPLDALILIGRAMRQCQDFELFVQTVIWECSGHTEDDSRSSSSLSSSPRLVPEPFLKNVLDLLPGVSPPAHLIGRQRRRLPPLSPLLEPIDEAKIATHKKRYKEKESRFCWKWSRLFDSYGSTLAEIVNRDVVAAIQSEIDIEVAAFKESRKFTCHKLKDGDAQQSKIVTESCFRIVNALDAVFPVVSLPSGQLCIPVKRAFVAVLQFIASSFLSELAKVTVLVPREAHVQCYYVALSSAAHLQNKVAQYVHALNDEEDSVVAVSRQIATWIVDQKHLIVDYHIQSTVTVVLQDAESNYYADPKPFYEDERCSFGIQMWNYTLKALRHDLWTTLPPALAKPLFRQIFVSGLSVLSARYDSVDVSESRRDQFRSDIIALVSIVGSFVWSVANSPSDFIQEEEEEENVRESSTNSLLEINSHCNKLLDIWKTTGKDPQEIVTSKESISGNVSAAWLSQIEPSIFERTGPKHLFVVLKWLAEQPLPDWTVLLEALVKDDCFLAALLLAQNSSWQLHKCLFTVLSKAPLPSDSLAKAFAKVAEREGFLDDEENPKQDVCSTTLFRLLNIHIKPLLERLLVSIIDCCCSLASRQERKEIALPAVFRRFVKETEIPCENSPELRDFISSTIEEFPLRLLSLPRSVLLLLHSLDRSGVGTNTARIIGYICRDILTSIMSSSFVVHISNAHSLVARSQDLIVELLCSTELSRKLTLALARTSSGAASTLCSPIEGSEGLRYLYTVVKVNLEWLANNWKIGSMPYLSPFAQKSSVVVVKLVLPNDSDHLAKEIFIPALAYNQIGMRRFDHGGIKRANAF
ncbi:uncharacterized protein KIAA0825 homolog isoform X3 [Oscarella lobularis]|uniref:uncharacterized protein KIAA0825 homolog isoform X3 n=1 Tax=Oscarella lobularis TaxID=121494 RepID=UPI003313DB29